VSRRWLAGGVLRGRAVSVLDVLDGRPLARLRVLPDPDAPAPAGTGPVVHAPAGPLEVTPGPVGPRDAEAMLRTALAGVVMGRADRAAVTMLARTVSPQLLVALASLVERARCEGPAVTDRVIGGAW
jgi:hypothetical protein